MNCRDWNVHKDGSYTSPAGLTGNHHLLWTVHQWITSLSPVVTAGRKIWMPWRGWSTVCMLREPWILSGNCTNMFAWMNSFGTVQGFPIIVWLENNSFRMMLFSTQSPLCFLILRIARHKKPWYVTPFWLHRTFKDFWSDQNCNLYYSSNL